MADHLINGEFVAIPLKTLKSKKWRDLKGYSRAIFMTMATKYRRTGPDADGMVDWSQVDLIAESGVPSSTLKRGMKELKQKGFVVVWIPGGRWHSETTYDLTEYMDG